MDAEPLNFEESMRKRKESAKESMREISEKELLDLIPKLFPDGMHPWIETFTEFIHAHRAETALQGETSDGISFVYFPTSATGIWYFFAKGQLQGVGELGKSGLEALKEIYG